jgi:pimeloyl-ACP methyl ester carboxylesterase
MLPPVRRIPGQLNHLRRQIHGRIVGAGCPPMAARSTGPDPRQRLLEWRPREETGRTVLLIHGGGFQERGPEDYLSLGPSFARAGWRAVAVGYRLMDLRAAVADVLAAVDAQEPGFLATWGYSAGALLSVLAALERPERVGAAVAAACPSDLLRFPELNPFCDPQGLARYSPGRFPPAAGPPIFLVQGTDDRIVPASEAAELAAHHPAVDLRWLPGGGHSLRWPPLGAAAARREMRTWLEHRAAEAAVNSPS